MAVQKYDIRAPDAEGGGFEDAPLESGEFSRLSAKTARSGTSSTASRT